MKDLQGKPLKESAVQEMIRQALAPYCFVFRANVGRFRTQDGRWISTGLPKGFPDLFGFRKKDGRMFLIEVKTEGGRLSKEQKEYKALFEKERVLYGVAKSPEDALAIVQEKHND